MSVGDPVVRNFPNHLRILGVCWILYGVFRLVKAAVMFLYSGTATVMFGALLDRVPNPLALMADFHLVYALAVALSVLCGVVGILAGLSLPGGSRTSRTLALFAGFLSLCDIPLGTTLGIYTLIVLLPMGNPSVYSRSQ